MDKRAAALSFILAVLFSLNTVGASTGTAQDLLSIYGHKVEDSVEVAASQLEALEVDYAKQQSALYDKQLMIQSNAIGGDQLSSWIANVNVDITELANKSNQLIQEIDESLTGPAETLIQKDSEYATAQNQLKSLYAKRESLLSQTTGLKSATPSTQKEEKAVASLAEKVDTQKAKVAKAKSYETLGEVLSVRHPVNNDLKITSEFGSRWNPVTQTSTEFHKGLDFRAPMRSQVLAAWNGTVEEVTTSWGGGNTIWINHGNGIKTVYMHLSEFKVTKGQQVKQYDVIALSGNSGALTTGPHLHLGIYINGNAVDPSKINWR